MKLITFIARLFNRRVVTRQWDGCMAHYVSKERYGIATISKLKKLPGSRNALDVYWLIRFDDGKWQWYPKCFFGGLRTEWGTHVRNH